MSTRDLSTWCEGDPASCRRTARRLERLALAVDDTATLLATQAAVPEATFDGWAATAYRHAAGSLHGDVRRLAAAHHALAAGLTAFADALDGVHLVMRRCRELATQHLEVRGATVLAPGPYADDAQHRVFALLEQTVHDARRAEHDAHRSWQQLLAVHTGPGTDAAGPGPTSTAGLPPTAVAPAPGLPLPAVPPLPPVPARAEPVPGGPVGPTTAPVTPVPTPAGDAVDPPAGPPADPVRTAAPPTTPPTPPASPEPAEPDPSWDGSGAWERPAAWGAPVAWEAGRGAR